MSTSRDSSRGRQSGDNRGFQGKKKKEYKKIKATPQADPAKGIRLNKYISNSGVSSRREADKYIASGNVVVNGNVITEMGFILILIFVIICNFLFGSNDI